MQTNSYCIVYNIPPEYRSKHLRNYFNELIERNVFNCFHYRHRPQNCRTFSDNKDIECHSKPVTTSSDVGIKRFCAIIDIKSEFLNEFYVKFNDKFWINFDNECDFHYKCLINKIKVVDNDCQRSDKCLHLWRKTIELNSSFTKHKNREFMTRLKTMSNESNVRLNESSDELMLTLTDVKSLRELNPPKDVMPNGNVGTPSEVFLQLIRDCRLPAPVIAKLDLEFPKSMRRRMYSRVGHKYENRFHGKHVRKVCEKSSIDDNSGDNNGVDLVKTRNGFIVNETFSECKIRCDNDSEDRDKCDEPKEDSDSDEDELEEWDRYESLHEDVTQQERIAERLFEEEVELKWEKGGSGLVFYTDAQFWDMKDNCEDYNEKTPDDWDLDLSLYRNNCSADKDAIDLKTLTDEMKLRKGKRMHRKHTVGAVDPKKCKSETKIGCFERHTKGFGRKIMESQGWICGQGLGQSIPGIPEPIADCGQMPFDKRGFGFRGEKLKSFQFHKQKTNNI